MNVFMGFILWVHLMGFIFVNNETKRKNKEIVTKFITNGKILDRKSR